MDNKGEKGLRARRFDLEKLFGEVTSYPHCWRAQLDKEGVFKSELFSDADKELMSIAPWLLYLVVELLEE